MAVNDFTGKNIQDTYQRVVQTDGTNLADGTGSLLPISFDGNNVIIEGNITAQTYVVSQSIINISSGSTIFGNSTDDTHQFTGSIDILNNLNLNGSLIANNIQLADNSKIISSNNSTTFIELQNDDGFNIRANNVEVFSIFSQGVVVNDNGAASADFRIESDNNTHIFFVDSGNNKVAIGTSTTSNSLLTIGGDVTAINITASLISASDSIQTPVLKGDLSEDTQLVIDGILTLSGSSGHLTASGNISSSGTIIANNFSASNAFHVDAHSSFEFTIANNHFNMKNNAADKDINFLTTAGSGHIGFGTNNNNLEIIIGTGGHITASGNISASGTIFADQVKIDEHTALNTSGSNQGRVFGGANITGIQIGRNGQTDRNIELLGPVTASGNISSSGDLIVSNINGTINGGSF